jgi:hypothetical protein
MPLPRCRRRSTRPGRWAGWARTSRAAACTSTCEVRVGAGAYICGEETSMLESLEGAAARCGPSRRSRPSRACSGAHGGQQRAHPGHRAGHPRRRRRRVCRARHRPLPRHAGLPAGRQRGARWAGRARLRGHPARAGRGLRRRHRAPAGRCAPCRSAARSAPTCRPTSSMCRWTTRRSPRPGRMLGHGGIVVFDDTVDMAGWPASRWSSAPRSPAASARPAASGRARRRDHRPDHRRPVSTRGEPGAAARPLPHDGPRFAVRHGWPDAHAGAQRPHHFPTTSPAAARRPAMTEPDVLAPRTRPRHSRGRRRGHRLR